MNVCVHGCACACVCVLARACACLCVCHSQSHATCCTTPPNLARARACVRPVCAVFTLRRRPPCRPTGHAHTSAQTTRPARARSTCPDCARTSTVGTPGTPRCPCALWLVLPHTRTHTHTHAHTRCDIVNNASAQRTAGGRGHTPCTNSNAASGVAESAARSSAGTRCVHGTSAPPTVGVPTGSAPPAAAAGATKNWTARPAPPAT